jgi:hypothetical protein
MEAKIKTFWMKLSPQKARGLISHGCKNQNVLEEIKPQKARGLIPHRSENQNVSEEMKPPKG